jgi:SAM-dependent methyltransferase
VTKTVANNFFDEWSIYDQVLDHNYMYHDEIYGDVRRILADRYETRPFMLLDLGCGSARHLARALQGRPVSRYVGYDLSDVALAHARRNLTGLGCPVDLRRGDLLGGPQHRRRKIRRHLYELRPASSGRRRKIHILSIRLPAAKSGGNVAPDRYGAR